MAKYIDQSAAIARLTHLEVTTPTATMTDAKRALADMFSADVEPVVHGEWLEKSSAVCKRYFECSHCGAHENKHTAVRGYYCWRCGAKMDGGEVT